MHDPTDIGLKEEPSPGMGADCPYYQHASKLADHGDLEAARDIFLRSCDVDFANAHAWAALSMVYAEMDEPEHAAEAARQAVRSDPNDAEWYIVLSDHLLGLGKYEECERVLGKALEIVPNHQTAFFNRAIMHAAQKADEAAIADLKHAVELEETLADAAINVEEFDYLREREDFPKALEAEGFNPNSPFANLKIEPEA